VRSKRTASLDGALTDDIRLVQQPHRSPGNRPDFAGDFRRQIQFAFHQIVDPLGCSLKEIPGKLKGPSHRRFHSHQQTVDVGNGKLLNSTDGLFNSLGRSRQSRGICHLPSHPLSGSTS